VRLTLPRDRLHGQFIEGEQQMWRLPEFVSEEDLLDMPMILLLVLASVLQSSVTYSPGDSLCLGNEDVVTLVAHGLPESMVLRAIEKTKNKFDVSPASLRDLRKAGISDALIAAMCSTQLTESRQPVRRVLS